MSQPEEMTPWEFQAWCEWRKWCSVFRVECPCPSEEEIAAGKVDDIPRNEREEFYKYLSGLIIKVIRNRLNNWYLKHLPRNLNSLKGLSTQEEERFVSFFDEYMTKDKKKEVPGFQGNSYKDYIFFRIQQSTDAPGKIIFGKIFALNGYLNSIIQNILNEDIEFERGPRGGIHKNPQDLESLEDNQSDNKNDGPPKIENIASEDEKVLPDDAEIGRMVVEALSREEKLILAALIYRVRVSNPRLLAVLHCGKERAYNLHKRLVTRLRTDFPELEESPTARRTMIDLIFSELSAEKETKSFLLSIENHKEGDSK